MKYGVDELAADIYKGGYDCFSIGKSEMGRDILAVKIGAGSVPLLVVGAHHAREAVSSWFILRELERLSLPRNITLYAVPMLNPDGVMIANTADGTWKANARGVDLNRNYPCLFFYKASAKRPCSEGFKGYYPLSEKETSAMAEFTKKIAPAAALSFHAKGEEIYFADENTPEVFTQSKRLAEELSLRSGYRLNEVSKNPEIYAAGYENWFRERFKKPCLLIELTPYNMSPYAYSFEEWENMTAAASGIIGAFAELFNEKW